MIVVLVQNTECTIVNSQVASKYICSLANSIFLLCLCPDALCISAQPQSNDSFDVHAKCFSDIYFSLPLLSISVHHLWSYDKEEKKAEITKSLPRHVWLTTFWLSELIMILFSHNGNTLFILSYYNVSVIFNCGVLSDHCTTEVHSFVILTLFSVIGF